MKNEILDEPIRDTFSDYLQQGETIVWEGQPRQNNPFTGGFGVGVFIFCFYFLLMHDAFKPFTIPIIISILVGHIVFTVYKNKKKGKTKYAISQKSVFFQIRSLGKTEIHTIPFEDLNNVIVTENDFYLSFKKGIGVIHLGHKNPAQLNFTTYDFDITERRHQPTLELIEDVNKIAELIRQGIRNVNTLL